MIIKNYKLVIQYDGSNFHGWQFQPNVRTVQGDIEAAFSLIYPSEKITLIGAGRTDAGVHAVGQVANIKLPIKLSTNDIQNALNGNLKNDVRVDNVEEMGKDFHARFSAVSREYEYHIVRLFSPIKRNYAVSLKHKIDFKLLVECSKILIGEYDFDSFCKSTSEVENKNCLVSYSTWEESSDMYIFKIKANRFLHHMVRYLVGTMLEVARGKYTIRDFKSLIANTNTTSIVLKAPAKGLFLKKIYYN